MTLCIAALAMFRAVGAHADAQVASTVQQDLTIEYKLPSGEPQSASLGKGVASVGTASVTVAKRSSTAITVRNAAGDTVATGRVDDDGSYILMPKGDGFALHRAGSLVGPWTPYPGVVIVNALPESYRVDLFGQNGKVGIKSARVATAFDAKQAAKLGPGDEYFKVVIHLPDGSTMPGQSTVARGRFYVVHKTYDDKVTLSALGYIQPPPGKPARKRR